ncbi:MAG: type I-F CRISPR-associated endoribonuclease Cas6/Csy4 [Gammaproteobacteria bacterium]|nr:type I-F CRISPR-associated endoribonuclease Cas6/Csy4 [Gammaproteobacteria bacterium]
MNHYIEIRILPDPEFVATMLMNALFTKLHRGLIDLGSGAVGVSFPDITLEPPFGLGERLRLHGDGQQLSQLMELKWMMGLRDYTETSGLLSVPTNIQHRTFFRVQAKSGLERLRRRRIQRHGVDVETAVQEIPAHAVERLKLPYVMLASRSTGQRFPLFVDAGDPVDTEVVGKFGTYGLSRTTTTPWF